MRDVVANAGFWTATMLVAATGMVGVRFVAPVSAGSARIFLTLGGQVVVIGGLFIICLGVRRRIKAPAVREEI